MEATRTWTKLALSVAAGAILLAVACFGLVGCSDNGSTAGEDGAPYVVEQFTTNAVMKDAVDISLSDSGITVDGKAASTNTSDAVYLANDIVYYESGKDFTYGEGTDADAHSAEEAQAHTVVHITKPGTYALSGTLSKGQIAIDLGEDAVKDPEAIVTLVLNDVDITSTVAPGVIFYNVYECGSTDVDSATMDVDTLSAGANVIIADGTENTVNGSYVARIYKSVELSEDGTTVVDSKKLHKYDGAFYSKRTMNVFGDSKGTGVLNINAENEGLDTELHLGIWGGVINIAAGNDGINTNEDNVSVTAIHGGELTVTSTGTTGEGDGIDSNGWIVIDSGLIKAYACSNSLDAGVDADKGIYLNGGTVVATGSMFEDLKGEATFAVLAFQENQQGGKTYELRDSSGKAVLKADTVNEFSNLVITSSAMGAGGYTLWCDDKQLSAVETQAMGGAAMGAAEGMDPNAQGAQGEPGAQGGQADPGALGAQGAPNGQAGTPPNGDQQGTAANGQNGTAPTPPDGTQAGQAQGAAPTPPSGDQGAMQGGQGGTPPEMPAGAEAPQGMEPPTDANGRALQDGQGVPAMGGMMVDMSQASTTLSLVKGANYFVVVV